ncbi:MULTISPECIES: nucleoside-diphosphate kinase [unclassified Pseudomonas]|uniref:nucleoside-diphosphate kinase n=1 Tax=unclassified Pseudomonas TaxID=196821 RepID=UPI00131C59E0|nr:MULTISPECIES: nucleoside-diphosphate kinase [unclassified Pseudomonas]
MARNQTLIIIKPDAVHRGLVGSLLGKIERCGFKLKGLKAIMLSDSQFYALYPKIRGKSFEQQFRAVMMSGPCIPCVFEGNEAIKSLFSLAGTKSHPEDDLSMSLRKTYSSWTGADVIHRADSEEEAKRHISIFFKESELLNYYKTGEEFSSQEAWDEHGHRWL